jgi:hypothetical protein
LLCTSRNLRTPIPHIIMLINAINDRLLIFILTLSGSIGFKGGFVMPTSIMWMYFWNWHSLIIGAYSGCQKTLRYSNVFFYNHLCRNSVFRNIIMESGINNQCKICTLISAIPDTLAIRCTDGVRPWSKKIKCILS